MSTTPEAEAFAAPGAAPTEAIVRERTPGVLRGASPVPTYVGMALVVVGFALLAIAWGGVAGEADVARQMPYLISGGMVGLGLILVGLTVVNVAVKRRDAAQRAQQIELLAAALSELKAEQEDD